ncbi:PREDICTED: uncharacterized protein LOC107113661 [Gekko japonicus]|uniref:Uncharacterized protein LOC107113661 n=1 Tax=Gekko japonicus TaxID=146911 RepID=A0ABM1K9W1_GEKJA|nr:PREDICTED: uncharacterized protein LOC107113661 [Gekko japonicus]
MFYWSRYFYPGHFSFQQHSTLIVHPLKRSPVFAKQKNSTLMFAVPSCASAPAVGFGSAGLGYGGLHSDTLIGAGSPSFAVPSVASSPVVGFGSASLGHNSGVPFASLGVLSGVNRSCINQIPPAEVVVQPPPVVMTIPGPILSATGQLVFVGGNTPCAVSYGGSGSGLSGGSDLYGSFGALGGRLGSYRGRRGSLILGRRGSNCLPPQ